MKQPPPLWTTTYDLVMRRVLVLSVVLVVLVMSTWLAVELLTKPKDIDVSDCKTRWKDGRIASVVCPGGLPG